MCPDFTAPSAPAAEVIANELCGPMGSWRVGPDVEIETFLRSEYLTGAVSMMKWPLGFIGVVTLAMARRVFNIL